MVYLLIEEWNDERSCFQVKQSRVIGVYGDRKKAEWEKACFEERETRCRQEYGTDPVGYRIEAHDVQ